MQREASLAFGRSNGATCFELLQRQGARAVVLGSELLQSFHNFGVFTRAEQILGRLLELNDGDSKDGHDQDEGASGKQRISPSPVIGLATRHLISTVPLGRRQEAPGNEAGDGLTETPPGGHEGNNPLVLAGEVFEEDGGVEDEVAAATKGQQRNEKGETGPVGHGTSDNAGDGANEERDVKRILATNDVGAETPEERTRQHSHVHGDGQSVLVAVGAKFLVGWSGNNRLKEEDERIDSIAIF